MGLYMYVSNEDRITKRKVSDESVNEEFQEALKYDPSLMIEEHFHRIVRGKFKKHIEEKTTYSVYHETLHRMDQLIRQDCKGQVQVIKRLLLPIYTA